MLLISWGKQFILSPKNLVEVVKGSETTVSSLNEEVENRRKELEECRKDLSRKNGN